MKRQSQFNQGLSARAVFLVMLALWLVTQGIEWLIIDRNSEPLLSTVTRVDIDEVHAELKAIREMVKKVQEALQDRSDATDLSSREPIPSKLNHNAGEGPDKTEPDKTAVSIKEKKKGDSDPSEGSDFFAGWNNAKLLAQIEDPDERRALAERLLGHPSTFIQSQAIIAMLEFDPAAGIAAVYGLLDAAQSDPKGPWSACIAVQSIGDIEGYSASADLYRFYESEIDGVPMAAARALERQGDPSLIDRELGRMALQLNATEPRDRLNAIRQMGETGSSRAVPHLLPLLSNRESEIRLRTLDSLGRSGNESTIPHIERMLNDPVAAVRDRAVLAIETIRKRAAE